MYASRSPRPKPHDNADGRVYVTVAFQVPRLRPPALVGRQRDRSRYRPFQAGPLGRGSPVGLWVGAEYVATS
jgi:hypothetical protein